MKLKKVALLFTFGLAIAAIAGCNKSDGEAPGKTYYNISFLNDDQSLLKKVEVEEGQLPAYEGTPEKAATAEYTYTFNGWDKEIVAAKEDTSYVATYTSTKRSYTVKFVDADGTELQKETLEYGVTPTYKGTEPTKAQDAGATYAFAGWDKQIAVVTEDATYTATYSSQVRQYLVKFLDENGTELQSGLVNYGATPAYNGTPTKAPTAQYEYEFAGWDHAIAPVTEEATYTATYSQSTRKYTVHFDSDGGTEIADQLVEYGSPATKPDDPTKARDSENIYFFEEWDDENGAEYDFGALVTGNVNLTAIYDAVSATEHGDRCTYIHYEGKEATYVEPGYEEFWYCELHEDYVLVKPDDDDKIVEATEPFDGVIASTDDRYLPRIANGEIYLKLDIGSYTGGEALVYSNDSFEHIVKVSFKAKIEGEKVENKSAWWGVGISATHDLYGGLYSNGGYYPLDNHWRTYSISADVRAEEGFVNFVHAAGEFAESSALYLDDIKIEYDYGDEVIYEDFQGDEYQLGFDEEFVSLEGVRNDNNYAHLVVGNDSFKSTEYALLFAKDNYSSIQSVSFNARIHSTETSWWGVGITDGQTDPDIYGGRFNGHQGGTWYDVSVSADEEWHTVKKNNTGNGIVMFGTECGHFAAGSTIDIDDIVIELEDGTKITEDFEGAVVFTMYMDKPDNDNSKNVYLLSEEVEEYDPTKDRFFRLDATTLSSTSTLHTADQLTGVVEISFKARITGGPKDGTNPWFGFGVSDDLSIYHGMHTKSYSFDGEWHDFTIAINPAENGYVKLIQAAGEFVNGTTIDIDDVEITYNNGAESLSECFDDIYNIGLVMETSYSIVEK